MNAPGAALPESPAPSAQSPLLEPDDFSRPGPPSATSLITARELLRVALHRLCIETALASNASADQQARLHALLACAFEDQPEYFIRCEEWDLSEYASDFFSLEHMKQAVRFQAALPQTNAAVRADVEARLDGMTAAELKRSAVYEWFGAHAWALLDIRAWWMFLKSKSPYNHSLRRKALGKVCRALGLRPPPDCTRLPRALDKAPPVRRRSLTPKVKTTV